MPEPTTPVRVPELTELTEEQREQMRQAMANATAGLCQIFEALGPAALAAAKQLEDLGEQLRATSSYRPHWADHFAYKPGRS